MLIVDVPRYIWTHPSNRGSRLRHLGRGTRFQLRGRLLGRRTVVPLGSSSRIFAELHRTASSRAAYANPPDIEMLVWEKWLRPGDLFIDVGANVGIYSLLAAELQASVVAVEPDPDTLRRLRENADLNGYRIEAIEGALSDHIGVERFTTGLDCVNRFADQGVDGAREVRTTTLDEVIGARHVRGVKIDVEGAERLVLEGGRRALQERRIDLLQIEWAAVERSEGHPQEGVYEQLDRCGYSLWRDDGTGQLEPLTSWKWDRDVFACIEPAP